MAEAIIAGALKNIEHIAVFDRLAETRFNLIDTGTILTNLFDTVDASLLDVLAGQMDMLGYNGWLLAETDQEKRELLKGAVSLKKIMGTPGGIREVVQRLGFLDIEIVEGWDNFNDGTPEPDEAPWAYFKVTYVLPNSKGISEEIAENLIGLINHYKNARSKLGSFGFKTLQEDGSGIGGELNLKIYTNDVLTENTTVSNVILMKGLNAMQQTLAALTTENFYTHFNIGEIAFGTNGTAPGDPTVEGGLMSGFIKPIDSNEYRDYGQAEGWVNTAPEFKGRLFRFSLGTSEGNGSTFRELGLIMRGARIDKSTSLLVGESSIDIAFNRVVRAPIVKNNTIRIEGTWFVGFGNTKLYFTQE